MRGGTRGHPHPPCQAPGTREGHHGRYFYGTSNIFYRDRRLTEGGLSELGGPRSVNDDLQAPRHYQLLTQGSVLLSSLFFPSQILE